MVEEPDSADIPSSVPSRRQRRAILLRLDPAVHEAVAKWAADELRSVNGQIEFVLRRALTQAGRSPQDAAPLPRRVRRPKQEPAG